VITAVTGGTMKSYTYHIPADHAPGMHWYHSHFHGASAVHMQSGMVGAILVQSSSLPTIINTLYSTAELAVLSYHKFIADTYGECSR